VAVLNGDGDGQHWLDASSVLWAVAFLGVLLNVSGALFDIQRRGWLELRSVGDFFVGKLRTMRRE